MPKIDLDSVPQTNATGYPPPYAGPVQGRWYRRLAPAAGLVDDTGEHPLRAGDVAAFPKGDGDGHVLQNRSDAECVFVAIGRPAASDCHYPDIDMHLANGAGFRRKDGSAF